MKRLLLATALLSVAGCKPAYYVAGDSLTDERYSWAQCINNAAQDQPEMGFPHMKLAATQKGQVAVGYDFPSHLRGDGETGFIMFLGANDAYWQVPPPLFESAYRSFVTESALAGFTLTCVLVPVVDGAGLTAARVEPYRQIQRNVCPEWVDVAVELKDSEDGIHMGPDGSCEFAAELLNELGKLHGAQKQ